jgi:hypothetical protein
MDKLGANLSAHAGQVRQAIAFVAAVTVMVVGGRCV